MYISYTPKNWHLGNHGFVPETNRLSGRHSISNLNPRISLSCASSNFKPQSRSPDRVRDTIPNLNPRITLSCASSNFKPQSRSPDRVRDTIPNLNPRISLSCASSNFKPQSTRNHKQHRLCDNFFIYPLYLTFHVDRTLTQSLTSSYAALHSLLFVRFDSEIVAARRHDKDWTRNQLPARSFVERSFLIAQTCVGSAPRRQVSIIGPTSNLARPI